MTNRESGSESKSTLLQSFDCAFAGWMQAVRQERNLRIHLIAAAGAGGLCWYLPLTSIEIGLIVVAVGTVWVTELLNSSIERIVDLVSPDYSELARDAKNFAAAAVLTASVASIAIGLLVFGPYLIEIYGDRAMSP